MSFEDSTDGILIGYDRMHLLLFFSYNDSVAPQYRHFECKVVSGITKVVR